MYQTTETTDMTMRSLRSIERQGGVMVLHGAAGIGKTVALQLAGTKLPRMRRVLLAPVRGDGSLRSMLVDIADAIELEPLRTWYTGQLARHVAAKVRKDDLTLAIDQGDMLREVHFEGLRYLLELIPRMALVGGPAMLARITASDELRTHVTVPLAATPAQPGDFAQHYGDRFSSAFVSELHDLTKGNWRLANGIATRAESSVEHTRELGQDAARSLGAFILQAA